MYCHNDNFWYGTYSIQYLSKEFDILFCSITPSNLGKFQKPDLESVGPDVLKTHVQFDQVLAEISEVKDTWNHIIDLTERKTIEIWAFCVKSNW